MKGEIYPYRNSVDVSSFFENVPGIKNRRDALVYLDIKNYIFYVFVLHDCAAESTSPIY